MNVYINAFHSNFSDFTLPALGFKITITTALSEEVILRNDSSQISFFLYQAKFL